MLAPRYIPLVLKQVLRHRTRSLLTVLGVATAMFLFCGVQSMQSGVRDATQRSAADTTLVVYRENRYCPFTSKLPEHYLTRIKAIPGVADAVPVKVVVNNCRASLDVVTFRGVPPEDFNRAYMKDLELIEGDAESWMRRTDAALLGETLARRRGLKVGDRFDAAGITVYVAGVMRSEQPQDQNVAYVHLYFLQRSFARSQEGIVTQFNVKVADPKDLDRVAEAIDAEFASAQEPTQTSSEKAFVARAAADLMDIVGFTRWVGLACLATVLALVANAIVLSVQDRVKEHAVLQTLGFDGFLLARLIIAEGVTMGLAGGALGTLAAVAILRFGAFSMTNEGLSVQFTAGADVWGAGLAVSLLLGVLAGLAPAWQAGRREISEGFRAV